MRRAGPGIGLESLAPARVARALRSIGNCTRSSSLASLFFTALDHTRLIWHDLGTRWMKNLNGTFHARSLISAVYWTRFWACVLDLACLRSLCVSIWIFLAPDVVVEKPQINRRTVPSRNRLALRRGPQTCSGGRGTTGRRIDARARFAPRTSSWTASRSPRPIVWLSGSRQQANTGQAIKSRVNSVASSDLNRESGVGGRRKQLSSDVGGTQASGSSRHVPTVRREGRGL